MPSSSKTTVALFNYGGGMRGLISAHIMSRLEEKTNLRISDMVDIFAGPSTGAILNAAMNVPNPDHPGRPKYRARHLVKFYEREGHRIFPADRNREFRGIIHDFNNRTLKISQLNNLVRRGHYDPGYLSRAMGNLFEDTKLSDSLCSLIIPTYNIEREKLDFNDADTRADQGIMRTRKNFISEGGHALWLKNIKTGYPANAEFHTPQVSLYDAVMASCAAPTYFPCHHFNIRYRNEAKPRSISGIDGVIFDNPCISYLGAIRQHVPQDHKLTMLILGTGHTNRSVKKEDWNSYGALGIVDPVNDLPLINIFFHASESALMDSFASEMGENLFVFNKSMYQTNVKNLSTQIDDASPQNLEAMGHFVEEIMEEQKDSFEEVCHILVNNRDRKEDEIRHDTLAGRMKYYMSVISRKEK